MDRYEEDHWIRDWFDANEEMILLHDALCCRQIFRLIQEKDEILSEARRFPEQNSLFPEEDLELGERDREGLAITSSINLAMSIILRLFLERRYRRSHRKRRGRCWLPMGS